LVGRTVTVEGSVTSFSRSTSVVMLSEKARVCSVATFLVGFYVMFAISISVEYVLCSY